MKEYEAEVLEQYDMEVKGTRKMRGAFFCDTDEGAMLLKETKISERRASLVYIVLSRLELEGKMRVDTPVFAKDGRLLVTSRDGTRYMLKRWFTGRECDMKREAEIVSAAGNLALLHERMQWDPAWGQSGGILVSPPAGRDPLEEMERHNREMRKVRSFIRSRVSKNEFEYLYLEHYDRMYRLAESVVRRLRESDVMELYRRSIAEGRMVHGDYNYHNVLNTAEGTAVTNFEHARIDIQMGDLYYFMRKAMEKYRWKQKLGSRILEAYEEERRIEPMERTFLGLCLAYPEKFWKTASSYARSNKAWLPEKSVEKLQTAVRQTEEKSAFLENLFSLDLQG